MQLPPLDLADQDVITAAHNLLDQRKYEQASTLLLERVARGIASDTQAALLFLGEVAGLLIDIGAEGHDERAVKTGLALLEDKERFVGFVTASSFEYNMGNAKIALVDLRSRTTGVPPGLADHDRLLAAKNHYWRAFKLLNEDDALANVVRTNLANALRTSGRIPEALTAYEEVLGTAPTFGMAHFHRGLALCLLETLSRHRTVSLFAQQVGEYRTAALATDVQPAVREVATTMRDRISKRLERLGHTTETIQDEERTSRREATQHSPYRQFTLKKQLALSEHALYCHCAGARRDDLMIATTKSTIMGAFVPRMELIVNRLKAEFGTARLLYYQATTDQTWDLHEDELTFAELLEGEHVSMRTELLRTSFRLCLGILDKIALGICELYNVADEHEKLYFESFWQPQSRKGKASTRWTTLASKSTNLALVALYSQATDLGVDGEWILYKTWRNHLEHRFLLLTDEHNPLDVWKAREGTFGALCITESTFTDQTLGLLQFTRAAIFHFVWCVRYEAQPQDNAPRTTMTLRHKRADDLG